MTAYKYKYKTQDEILAAAARIAESRSYRYKATISSSDQAKDIVREMIKYKIGFESREHLLVCFLDCQNKIISDEILFSGTIDQAAVYPREIVKRSLELNAKSVILAHNHPSGTCRPSLADFTITKRINEALKTLDMKVLDHIIVSELGSYSFSENGDMR